jgi:hypothetical protein
MFVQVIQAKVADEAGVRKALERWESQLMGGADGYLGTTAGFLHDGSLIALARFESPDAARANSDRPEQGEWAAELTKGLEGEPTYIDVPDAELWLGGGSDDARFVQVMIGHSPDVDRLLASSHEVDTARYAKDDRRSSVACRGNSATTDTSSPCTSAPRTPPEAASRRSRRKTSGRCSRNGCG